MIFTQFVDDALGCASYLVGDPGTGQAVVVDPGLRDRAVPRGGRAARRPHRPRRRDAHARRPSRGPRAARARARRPGQHPSRGRRRVPARRAGGRRRDRARRHRPALHPHARPPARALLPRGQRPHARRRAVDRPHRRLAVRRRRRTARPRGRGARGRRGPLPLAPQARRARRRRRGVSRVTSPGRSAARR